MGHLESFSNEAKFMKLFHKNKGFFTLMLGQLELEVNSDAKHVNDIFKETAHSRETVRALKGLWEDPRVLQEIEKLLKGRVTDSARMMRQLGGANINAVVKLVLLVTILLFALLSAQDVFMTGEERDRPSIGQLVVGTFSGLIMAIPGVGDVLRAAGATGSWLSSYSKSSSGIPSALEGHLSLLSGSPSHKHRAALSQSKRAKNLLNVTMAERSAANKKFSMESKVSVFTAEGTLESVKPYEALRLWPENAMYELQQKEKDVKEMKTELNKLVKKGADIVDFFGLSKQREKQAENLGGKLASAYKNRDKLREQLKLHDENPFLQMPLHLIEPAEIGKYLNDEITASIRHFHRNVLNLDEGIDTINAKDVTILLREVDEILKKVVNMPETKFGEKYRKSIVQFIDNNLNMSIVNQILKNIGGKMAELELTILNQELISDMYSVGKLTDMVLNNAQRRGIELGSKLTDVSNILTSLQMYNIQPSNFEDAANILVDLLISPKITYMTREEVYKTISRMRKGVLDRLRLAVWEFLTCILLQGIGIAPALLFINIARGKIVSFHLGGRIAPDMNRPPSVAAIADRPPSVATQGLTPEQRNLMMLLMAQEKAIQDAAVASTVLPLPASELPRISDTGLPELLNRQGGGTRRKNRGSK